MIPRKCKQLAHEYIDTQLAKNPKWLDSITDSWYYKAGAWFEKYVKEHTHITIYSNHENYDYTPEFESRRNIFYTEIVRYKKQKEQVMEQENLEQLLNNCEKVLKEQDAMNKTIQFALNEWETNKRWFRQEPGSVTVEDVIKTCIEFGWTSKGNYDYSN